MTPDLTAAIVVSVCLALCVIGAWMVLIWIEKNVKGG